MEDGPEAVRAAVGVLAHPAQSLIQVGLRQLPLLARRPLGPEADAIARVSNLRGLVARVDLAGMHDGSVDTPS